MQRPIWHRAATCWKKLMQMTAKFVWMLQWWVMKQSLAAVEQLVGFPSEMMKFVASTDSLLLQKSTKIVLVDMKFTSITNHLSRVYLLMKSEQSQIKETYKFWHLETSQIKIVFSTTVTVKWILWDNIKDYCVTGTNQIIDWINK